MFERMKALFGTRTTSLDKKLVENLTTVLMDLHEKVAKDYVKIDTRLGLQAQLLEVLARKVEGLDVVRDAMNRVTELALVAAGNPDGAVQFRRAAGLSSPTPVPPAGSADPAMDLWGDGDVWPPPGHSEMVMKG